jgi:DNA-binding NarL/FixJ family response regulator
MKPISILLVDDHAVVREGLKALLASEPDMQVVGEAENGWQAINQAKELHPEIVLMDIAMPQLNGIEATRRLKREAPDSRVLVLSTFGDDDFIRQMTHAGVGGYLLKRTAAQDLFKAIREVHRGNAYFSPTIARRLRDQTRQVLGAPGLKSTELSTRESQVLQLIAKGYSNRDMGTALGISVKTVEKHRQQLMNKLEIHDIAGLTRYAITKGLLDQPVPPLPTVQQPAGPTATVPVRKE